MFSLTKNRVKNLPDCSCFSGWLVGFGVGFLIDFSSGPFFSSWIQNCSAEVVDLQMWDFHLPEVLKLTTWLIKKGQEVKKETGLAFNKKRKPNRLNRGQ